MPKVENFTKNSDTEWEHDIYNFKVVIHDFTDMDEGYEVQAGSRFSNDKKPIANASSLEEAQEIAVDWMRDHSKPHKLSARISPQIDHLVDYSFDENGMVDYSSWEEAFRSIGFRKAEDDDLSFFASEEGVTTEDMKENPEVIQDDNTYNYSANVSQDINFGTVDAGQQKLISFKVHQGGDVRGNYSSSKFMVSHDVEAYELTQLVNPEIFVDIESPSGDKVSEARLMAGGRVEFDRNELGIEEDQIWKLQEQGMFSTEETEVVLYPMVFEE